MVDSEILFETEKGMSSFAPQEKEPWLAVSASWLLPGAGHFYIAKYSKAAAFFSCGIFLQFILLGSLLLKSCPLKISVFLIIVYELAFPVFVCVRAYKCANITKSGAAKNSEHGFKNQWLAIFLTILFPGLGHLYLRKWLTMIVFFAAYPVNLILFDNIQCVVIELLVVILAILHLFFHCSIKDEKQVKVFLIFIFFLITTNLTRTVIKPYLIGKYILYLQTRTIGQSMEPTLKTSDWLVIDKLTYGWQDPKVGDIVVVDMPEDINIPKTLSSSSPFYMTKRIAAVEGESVQMHNTVLFVDDEPRIFNPYDPCVTEFNDLEEEIKFALKQKNFMKFAINEAYTVPENNFFILGDNRIDSMDSRFFGAVPREKIKGKIIKIVWPPSRAGSL